MRYLIISDIHSNWEALQAVLKDAEGRYDRIVCCGDLAGYGPDPNPVIEWARANLFAVIRGNHDRGCAGLEDLEWFNPVARAACSWTALQLTVENREYLRALPCGPLPVDGFQLIHGSPLDEDEYVMTLSDARNVFSYLETSVAFFGHTHLQGGFVWNRGQYENIARPQAPLATAGLRLDPDGAYLINCGSVGQPRDGDPRAAYAIFEPAEREVVHHRVAYDCGETFRKVREAGLPEVLGARLLSGR